MSAGAEAFAAARQGDGIEHSASKGWLVLGLIGGAIAGAALTLATGGIGTAVLAASIAGAAGGGGLGEVLGSMSWAPVHETGNLVTGSPDVFINGRPAVMAHITGDEKDKSRIHKMTMGMYAAKEFEGNAPDFRTGFSVRAI